MNSRVHKKNWKKITSSRDLFQSWNIILFDRFLGKIARFCGNIIHCSCTYVYWNLRLRCTLLWQTGCACSDKRIFIYWSRYQKWSSSVANQTLCNTHRFVIHTERIGALAATWRQHVTTYVYALEHSLKQENGFGSCLYFVCYVINDF